jgi:peptidoglycan-associated lipoprotein
MKYSVLVKFSVLGLALLVGATGCKGKKIAKPVTPIPSSRVAAPPTGGGPNPQVTRPSNQGGNGQLPNSGQLGGDTGATGSKIDLTKTESGIPLAPLGDFEGFSMDPTAFQAYSVYFDFDSYTLKKDELNKVNSVGDALKAQPANALLIEGHCDERGTEEYNRALGERRALALREYLVTYGVGAEKIRTRSWGEDRPADPGHDEAAWSKNRRGEFILLLPK